MIEVKPAGYFPNATMQICTPTATDVFVNALYDQPTIDALQARIAELETKIGNALNFCRWTINEGTATERTIAHTVSSLLREAIDAAIAKENSNA